MKKVETSPLEGWPKAGVAIYSIIQYSIENQLRIIEIFINVLHIKILDR